MDLICQVKVKVKVCTLDIPPLRESSPQKCSGVAHVLKDLTVLHTHTFIRNQNEPYLPVMRNLLLPFVSPMWVMHLFVFDYLVVAEKVTKSLTHMPTLPFIVQVNQCYLNPLLSASKLTSDWSFLNNWRTWNSDLVLLYLEIVMTYWCFASEVWSFDCMAL